MNTSKSLNDQEGLAKIDQHFGFNLRQTLQQMETELEGLALEIVIKETRPNGEKSQHSLVFKLKDDGERVTISEPGQLNEVEKLVQRIALLEKNHSDLLHEAITKVNAIQKEYDGRDYTVEIVKRKIPVETARKHENAPTLKRKNSHMEETQPVRHQFNAGYPRPLGKDLNMLIIGPYGTQIHHKAYETIRWRGGIGTTRELCDIIFGQKVLAAGKGQLDPAKTADIIYLVCSKFPVSDGLVRDAINSKCVEAARKNKGFPRKSRFN